MLIPIPAGVDSRNAALAEAFASALHGIRCAGTEGGSALVMGGGPIGLAAVRILKVLEFGPIVLSEPVEAKREVGKRFGADFVLDPLAEDVSRKGREWTGGTGFETILECSGVSDNVTLAFTLTAKGGTICIVSMFKGLAVNQPMALNFKEPRLTWSYSNTHEENSQCLKWMAEGKIDAREIISEVIDDDARKEHGYRREGIFFGMNGGITKLAFSAQGVLFASVMSAAGYVAGETVQTASAINGIRFMIGGTTIIASLITAFCMWKYPLGRAAQSVVTPATGD